ncbi:MAG: hypothetical protein E7218_05575 [Anaerofustis stercorihominis]|nr:hypothetical protein [Anaerofustis stercorihominis]
MSFKKIFAILICIFLILSCFACDYNDDRQKYYEYSERTPLSYAVEIGMNYDEVRTRIPVAEVKGGTLWVAESGSHETGGYITEYYEFSDEKLSHMSAWTDLTFGYTTDDEIYEYGRKYFPQAVKKIFDDFKTVRNLESDISADNLTEEDDSFEAYLETDTYTVSFIAQRYVYNDSYNTPKDADEYIYGRIHIDIYAK